MIGLTPPGGLVLWPAGNEPLATCFWGVIMQPEIQNITLTNANTEYPCTITRARFIQIQTRTAVDTRFAFETGKVAGSTNPFATVKSGSVFSCVPPEFNEVMDATLYLANGSAGSVVEVIVWR